MRYLVTGATGRIGSRFVPRLLAHGANVRVLVREPQRAEFLRQQGAEIFVGDLLGDDAEDRTEDNAENNVTALAKAVAGMDGVIHLAAHFRGATPEQVRAVNVAGTVALAQAAQAAHCARFIFASTNLVYGPRANGLAREDEPTQPGLAYPQSKLAAEAALSRQQQQGEMAICILRLAFVYGEGDPHLAEGMNWFRTWHPQRPFQLIHHADVAQAILLALETPKLARPIDPKAADGGAVAVDIYNVADDRVMTAAQLMQVQGESPAAEAYTRPRNDPPESWNTVVDTSKIRQTLGFAPLYPSLYDAVAANAL